MGIIDYAKAYFGKPKKDWEDAPKDTTGLTCFKVVNDLHIGSKYQDNPKALELLQSLTHDGRTVLNGDIFDLTCCKKKEVNKLELLVESYLTAFGHYYKTGNHEAWDTITQPLVLNNNGIRVGFAHGDLTSDFKKWSKYRKKKHGAGWFKLLASDFLDDLDHLKAMRPLPKQFLPNAEKYCQQYGLSVLVVGHFHPEAERRYKINNKLIIILPAHKLNEVWL